MQVFTCISPRLQVDTCTMSKFYQSDRLSILARYTSVVAVAIASSSLPLKDAANDQTRDDQARIELGEGGRSEVTDPLVLD
jgi:hypothetical protein